MFELIVVGGGPAGLAAACSAWENGVKDIAIIERDQALGGILNQCIHNGFGLHYFGEELTGPEYAERFVKQLKNTGISVFTDTMVLDITPEKEVHIINAKDGYQVLRAKAIVLAMGCRERTRGAISIPGTRPAGVLTAGAAQRYVNMEGQMVGKRVVILGSGDIGLIMARRMTLEGAKVLACIELMPYSGGLNRNIVQCLHDYNIPLYLSHTITDIKGYERVKSVCVAKVDQNRAPVPGTEFELICDTVLLSVGLIPENELTKQAGIPIDPRTNGAFVYENMETETAGIFACGNVVHVHDLVDFVTAESQRAGLAAADYIKRTIPQTHTPVIAIKNGAGVTYTVPQHYRPKELGRSALEVFFRVNEVSQNKKIKVYDAEHHCVASFQREYLAPGEMEKIRIPTVLLEKNCTNCLTVCVEEE